MTLDVSQYEVWATQFVPAMYGHTRVCEYTSFSSCPLYPCLLHVVANKCLCTILNQMYCENPRNTQQDDQLCYGILLTG